MKKLLALLIAAMVLTGCTTKPAEPTATPEVTPEASTGLKVGVGSFTSLSTADATADKDGKVQANTTFATVVLEGDVIKYVSFDTAQNTGAFGTDGTITGPEDPTKTPTKKEKGADYGMLPASEIKKEWFEQIAAFEEYAVGKTVAEVLAMPTFDKGDGNHDAVPEVEELKTTVTMTVGDYLKALDAAAKNAVEVANVAKVGQGSFTSLSLADATADKDGKAQFNTTYAVVALDAEGKIVFTSIDTAQNTGAFSTAGVVTGPEDPTKTPTKKEKGADYGMLSASEIKKEWFEQIAAFEEFTVGKTVTEVLAMPTFDKGDGNHDAVPEVEELKTTVTMTVGDYLKALAIAEVNAVEIK